MIDIDFSELRSIVNGEPVDASVLNRPTLDAIAIFLEALKTGSIHDVQTSAFDTTANSLLRVGSFGLGARNTTMVTDLDAIVYSGLYSVSSKATNRPSWAGAAASSVLVMPGGGSGRCTQVHFVDNVEPPRIGIRNLRSNGTWTEWQEIYHSGVQFPLGATLSSAQSALGILKQATPLDATAGALMAVGAFGLGTPMPIQTVDLDTLNTTGFHRVSKSSTNLPVTANGTVLVVRGTSNAGIQIFLRESSVSVNQIWIRTQASGSYTPWREILHSDSTLSLASYFPGTLKSNGWTKLPNDLIFQWGSGVGSSPFTINFPTSFPNSVWSIIPIQGNTGTAGIQAAVNNATLSSFDIYHNGGGTQYAFRYIAVGI